MEGRTQLVLMVYSHTVTIHCYRANKAATMAVRPLLDDSKGSNGDLTVDGQSRRKEALCVPIVE